jgi:hypothetical protein
VWTINDLLKKLKRSLTWQWGQAGEDMFFEANKMVVVVVCLEA